MNYLTFRMKLCNKQIMVSIAVLWFFVANQFVLAASVFPLKDEIPK
jgi:hypothetical protein